MGEYTNACNNLVDAIQLVTDSSIEKAGYDKTIQAQILSCQDATIGKYRCRYQDAVIYAYASTSGMVFTNGTYVYILVPNGDMSKEKTILGTTKKLGINYISQAVGDQAYSIIGNNVITSDNKFYLNTKNINYKCTIYQNGSVSDVVLDTDALARYIKQSSSLIVGATFKTSIDPERQSRGHYGITYNLKFLDNTSNQQVIRSYTVDEDSMIDNPYRLIYDTRQYKIFDIDGPNFMGIESIQIFNSDFPNADGIETDIPLTEGDIEITKLEIAGAIRLSESEINGVAITFYTPQGTYFINNASSGSVKTITAQVRVKGKLVSNAQKIPFYWGMENISITPKSRYYNKYLGRGWKCLNESNIIEANQGSDEDPIIEWVPSNDTYIIKLSDAIAKNNKIKVAIIYDNTVITKEINIQNLGSIYDLTIESNDGTQFYYDIGHPTLTCKINGEEPEDTAGYEWVYEWGYEDNTGNLQPLFQTSDLNDFYDLLLNSPNEIHTEYQGQDVTLPKGLNPLQIDIDNGSHFINAQARNLEILNAKIKEFNYIQRVQHNRIYDVQINNITQRGAFKCSVLKAFKNQQGELTGEEEYLGTASIVLTNTLEGENLYSLVINNGSVSFQYDENGAAPNNKSLIAPQDIQGLSFTVYDNLGKEIDNDIIINDENCKIRWEFPIKQTMLVDKNTESSGTDPTLTYKYYDNRVNLIYDIVQRYDIKKQRNQIKLTVDYKGMSLTTKTDFTFVKQGQPGTNGTQYIVKLIPNTTMNNPPLWPVITKINNGGYKINYGIGNNNDEYTIYNGNQYRFFKAQLWRSGVKVWEGFSVNESAEDRITKPVKVEWQVLSNKYNSSTYDASSFSVGSISNTGFLTWQGKSNLIDYANPYADIIKCSITYKDPNEPEGSQKTYYGTIPVTIAWVSDEKYRVNLKDYTGWRYAIYSSDGTTPQYDSSSPFEFIIKEKINGIWEDISLVQGSHAITYGIDPDYCPVAIGNYLQYKKNNNNYSYQSTDANLITVLNQGAYRDGCEKNQWYARPVPRYDGLCVNAAITCEYRQEGTLVGKISVPIHFLLNKYGLSDINDWDGNSIQVNQEGGFILSPQFGAGVKDNRNNFTGVLMGEVINTNKSTTDVGLLGYSGGNRTFFLNSQNGSAIFGSANGAQITIDPSATRGLIYSGNFWKPNSYDKQTGLPNYGFYSGENFYKNYRNDSYIPQGNCNSQGMIIDLTTPQIYFGKGNFCVDKNGKLRATQANISGDITATSLTLTNNANIWNKIGDKPQEIETMKLYFSGGTLHKGDAPTSASVTGFSVNTNGLLQASNAIIWGTIYASQGQIGGWTIGKDTDQVSMISANNIKIKSNGSIQTENFSSSFFSGWQISGSGSVVFRSGEIAGWVLSETSVGSELYSIDDDNTIKVGMMSSWGGTPDARVFYINNLLDNREVFGVSTSGLVRADNIRVGNIFLESSFDRIRIYTGGHLLVGEIEGARARFAYNQIFMTDNADDKITITPQRVTITKKVGTQQVTTYMDYKDIHPGSDRRLKTNIKDIDSSLAKLLHPVSFNFIGDKETNYGFIAQEVQKILPDIVRKEENGYLSLSYNNLIAPLYALVQQQQKTIEDLELRLSKLERG